MLMRQTLLLALLIQACVSQAWAAELAGRWAVSQDRCETEYLLFEANGHYASTLDDDKREGTWKLARDRVTLTPADEPDNPANMHILDHTASRLVAFDETIEADRRLLSCR